MNNDGYGSIHNDVRTADENPSGVHRVVRKSCAMGGPMKEEIEAEMSRHKEARGMRLKHLQDHYKR